MMKWKCFDVTKMVIDDACERFSRSFVLDENKVYQLKEDCEVFDRIVNDANAELFEVDIDEITTEVKLSMTCREVIIKDDSYGLSKIFFRAKSFEVSVSDEVEDCIRIDIVFPSLWNVVR